MRHSVFRLLRLSGPWPWLILALVVRAAFLFEQSRNSPLFRQALLDEMEALDSARLLLDTGGFGAEPFFKAPGYTVVMAAVLLVFGEGGWPWGIRLLQHGLGVALAALAFDTTRRLVAPGRGRAVAGAVAAFAVAVHGPLVRLEGCPCLDFPVAFLQSAMVWALVRGATAPAPQGARRWLAAAGALAAAAWLTRPTITVVLPPLAALVAWQACRAAARVGENRSAASPAKSAMLAAAVFLAPTVVSVVAVAARNGAVAGEALPMPWQGGFNLFMANRAGANGRYLLQTDDIVGPGADTSANPTHGMILAGYAAAIAEGRAAPPADPRRPFGAADRHWFARARAEITSAPAAWAGLMARKMIYLASDKEVFNYEEYDLQRELSPALRRLAPGRFGWWFPLAAGALALAWAAPARRRGAWAVVALYAVALAPAIALYYASGRMRMPLAWPAMVLAAAGVGTLVAKVGRPGGARRAALFLVLFAAGAVAAWGDWWGVRGERMDHADLARMSNAAWRDGRFGMALEFADRAEAALPGYPALPLRRGQALYSLNRKAEAAAAFREAARRQPADPQGPFNLGVTLHYDLGGTTEALAAYDEALRRDPAHLSAACRAALAQIKLGDGPGARRRLDAAAPLIDAATAGGRRPAPAVVTFARVALACKEGRTAEARALADSLSAAARRELDGELSTATVGDCLKE